MATTPTAPARPRRRWKTVSLRGLMLLILLLAVWLGWETNRARGQKHAIEVIQRAGGVIFFDDLMGPDGLLKPEAQQARPAWQKWIMAMLGDDYVRTAYDVELSRFQTAHVGSKLLPPEFKHEITNLPHLVGLALIEADASDADLAAIGKLPRLRYLTLAQNPRITDAGMAPLEELHGLVNIQLHETPIGDTGISHLRGNSQLVSLRVGGTAIGDGTLALLPNWPRLRMLDLRGTRITDQGMVYLRDMRNLSELTLDDTQITGSGLANVAELKTLSFLSFRGTPTGDSGVACLASLDHLEVLVLGRFVSDASLPTLRNLKTLLQLDISSSQISDTGFDELKKALPSTRVLR